MRGTAKAQKAVVGLPPIRFFVFALETCFALDRPRRS